METTMEKLQRHLMIEEGYDFYEAEQAFCALAMETFDDLQNSELMDFLPTILSKERLGLFERLMGLLPVMPYSESYHRRSYRAPHNVNVHSTRIVQLILWLKNHPIYDFYEVFTHQAKTGYANGEWQLLKEDYTPIMLAELFTYELALRLNVCEARTEQYVRDILWKNGAHPLFTKALIRGIVLSEHEEMHTLLANVLLAAKNQEGVRQVIVESIDEGSLKAQLTFMHVIIAHDLLRFSSVVRAVDVWFGLGYDASNQKELHYVVQTSYAALHDETLVRQLLDSESSLDIFIALWCLACRDVNGVLARTDSLLMRENHVQQTVYYMLRNVDMHGDRIPQLVHAHLLKTNHFVTFMYGLPLLTYQNPSSYNYDYLPALLATFFAEQPWLAEQAPVWLAKTEQMRAQFSSDTYEMKHQPFPFLNATFYRADVFKMQLSMALYLKDEAYVKRLANEVTKLSVDCRDYFYFFAPACTGNVDLLLPALKDRSVTVRLKAIKQLESLHVPFEKIKRVVPSLLALKSGEMRVAVIELLKKQSIADIEAFAAELLPYEKELVRLGMLELLVERKEELTMHDWACYLPNATEKEQHYLRQLERKQTSFLDVPLVAVQFVMEPEKASDFTCRDVAAYNLEALAEKLQSLHTLIAAHGEVGYTHRGYEQEPETLIGHYLAADEAKTSMVGSIDALPLAEVWVDWLLTCELTVMDLYSYLYMKQMTERYYWGYSNVSDACKALANLYVSEARMDQWAKLFNETTYAQQVSTVLQYVVADGKAPLQRKLRAHLERQGFDYVAFCSGLVRDAIGRHGDVDLGVNDDGRPYTLADVPLVCVAFSETGLYAQNVKQVTDYFYTVSLSYERVEDYFQHIPLAGILLALDAGMLTLDHLRYVLCQDNFAETLTLTAETIALIDSYACAEDVYALIHWLQLYILEQELTRGDLETRTTHLVHYIFNVCGIDYFIRLLQALGDEKLSRQWAYSVQTRKDTLSTLLSRVEPVREETADSIAEKLGAAGFSEERLIEAMLYNTKLIPMLSTYIGWDGLEEVAWYFVAHTSEYNTEYEIAKIMQYSAIPVADFQRGAFDRYWFVSASAKLTKQQFNTVYEAAKYAVTGANHRRAQLYARATLGELDGEALKEEIRTKRNKEKLRAYSLLPATMDEAKERYIFFQQFLTESRAFGAQRRASEADAVEMAIFNLAQQVAAGNTTQFMWQMEQERYNELQCYFTPHEIEDVELTLVQDAQKVNMRVMKNGKVLKSVPKHLAKHETVLAMQAAKKELTEQSRRTRQQLERATCEEVRFDAYIVYHLLENPLFEVFLSQLIWCQGDIFYAIQNKQFVTLEQQVVSVAGDIQIAHPAHFYAAGNWRDWQRYVFEHGYQQPFKQVFRELYIPTADERDALFTSRFEGYQVQPNKAVALLKARGWKTSYEEPLRNISYRYNVMTSIDFVYDDLTPADVEAPTLQEITFAGRLTNEQLKLGDIAPVHFSEVMRDIDLVVSVAYAGEVDPEASHSTMEMRAVIAEEMIQLFQLTNACVKLPHIVIDGQLGRYTIHLGSGNVHQLGGAMIPVMAIPSQHRGRVFLPFVDEDPKTAEISAKLLLFADDDKINDPTIRAAIK